MGSGGARTRSGPAPDPLSRTSERRNYTLTALPSEGYAADPPKLSDYLLNPTDRHEAIWSDLWTTPQACAWSMERWRWPVVADLVAARVRADDPESAAGLLTSIRQLRDDCGLSKAGLAQNGWAIAADELAAKRQQREEDAPAEEAESAPVRRLRGDAQS